eukprot:TRINITY_DN2151_c0_g1_i1.p1 TRINITY_DN2151_c0_g1~~TRINITY_DN2151_c0_g1_i1.p1  ORF type:complete len:253 (-),score=49.01 TRINITY_DN2151_c0_g1_i1:98-856(-)
MYTLSFFVLVVTHLVHIGQCGHVNYQFPSNSGPFTAYTAHQIWTSGPTNNVFGSMQYWFEEGQGGYMGSQYHSDGTQSVLFSIWDSDSLPYSSIPLGQCTRFGGEGEGSHCLITYPVKTNTEYVFTLHYNGYNGTGAFWSGSVTDTTTGEATTMGTLYLLNVRGLQGFGLVQPAAASFIEYYTGGSFYSAYGWKGPYGVDKTGQQTVVVSARSDQEQNVAVSACVNAWGCGAPIAYYEEGPNVQTTPAQSLW